jgi:acyl-CoA dehydrogenase
MRLNWRKRYITLGPVSTLIGLAFRLRDPERLLGGEDDLGITCALVPSHLPGIEIGQRHDPMGVPFHNGPNSGRDVFLPLEFIVGGREGAGQGWRMLMESLAAGRSISLPALSVGAAQLAARVVGAYATVREQFDTPIGRFEGIEEPLARIGGLTYMMDAARTLTAGAVDAGERPAVLSAIVKCYLTEGMRLVVNDAMDIRAGAGICRGPRNILARAHAAAPIGITVEGANILTRSMIIYGQGAIRCHPHVREEMLAVAARDLRRFDRAFFSHLGFVASNSVRALLLGLTRGRLARPAAGGAPGELMRQLSRMSAAFALVSDAAMAILGGRLKRREKLSGRLADALAWLYLASAAVKRFHDEGRPQSDQPFVEWSGRHALHQVQAALLGILDNFPSRLAAWLLRAIVFPTGAHYRPPSDALGSQVARGLLEDREERLRLTRDIYVPPATEPGLGRLEAALDRAVEALAVETRIRDAVRAGRIDHAPGDALVELALAAGVITEEDRRRVRAADEAREEVIQVDAFDPAEYRSLSR